MSKLKKLNKLNKSKTLSVALSVGLVAANLVNVVPAMAVGTSTAHVMYLRNAITQPSTKVFKKGAAEDLVITYSAVNDATIKQVKNGSKALNEGADYTVDTDASTVTISQDYLMTQKTGKTISLKLDFTTGSDPVQKVLITDTPEISKLSSTTFDASKPKDIYVYLTLNGNKFRGVEGLTTKQYSGTSRVTIKKAYLQTLANGANTLQFNFDNSDPITCDINVTNSNVTPAAPVLKSVDAVNGTITATFDKDVTGATADDFAVTQKVDSKDAANVTPSKVDVNGKVVTLTVAPVVATAAAQSVVYSVSYSGGAAKSSDAVVVPAATATVSSVSALTKTAVTVANGTLVADAIAQLDQNVTLTLSDATTPTAAITWTCATYDGTKAGDYTFTGKIALPAGISDPDGKAADVSAKVTVSDAGLAVSSVSAINATTVSVVLATAPTTTPVVGDFTVLKNDTEVTASAVIKDAEDTTNKTYKLTVPTMANTQGTLKVNGISATITNSEYGYDFLAPSIVSVETLDNRKIKVNFSEKMHDNAAVASNYFLAKSSVIGTDLLDGAGSSAALSADKKSVTITLETGATLVPAAYTFRVTNATSNVMDIKGDTNQCVITGSELSFSPTTSQLTDMSGPILGSATYNSGTKVLALTFDESIDINPTSDFDLTKVTLGGVALGTGESIALSTGTTYNITLSAANASALPSGALTVSIAAGAIKDNATTQNSNDAINDFAVTKTSPPVATSASYDESTNRLTMNFDGAVKYTPVDWTKISVNVGGTTTSLATGTMQSTANGTSLILELTDANANTIENGAGTATTGTIKLAAGAVTSTGDVNNLLTNDVPLTYTQDTVVPTISSVDYNTETNLLTITFSEKMNITDASIDETKLAITDGTVTVTGEEAFYVAATTSSVTLPLNVSLGTDKTQTLEDDGTDVPDIDWSKAKLVVSAGHGLKDLQGNDLATNTYATAPNVTLTDLNRPKVTAAAAVDAKHVDVTFSDEKGLALDSASAQNVANYTIALNSNGTSPMTVTNASLLTNGRTVRLTLGSAHTFAASFKVTVANVTDKAGNAVSTTANNTATYNSVTTLDETCPVVNSVVGTAVAGRNNDTIAITFSEDVDSVSATNLANYTVEAPVGTVLPLNADNCSITYTANTATLKLIGINLQDGTGVKVTVGAGLIDKAGNPINRTVVANYSQTDTVIVPDGVAPTVTGIVGSAGATSDTITVYFSEEVQKATAELASNWTFSSPAGTTITATPTSRIYTYNDNGTPTNLADDTSSLVITYPAGTLAQGSTVRSVTAANGVVTLADLAGVVNAGAETDNGSVSDSVLPTITAVSGKTVEGGLDEIYVTFSEPVQSASAINKANYTIESPTGTAINMGELDAGDITYDSATKTVTIKLDTDDADTNVYAGGHDGWDATDSDYSLTNNASLKVTASNIQDMAGNSIVAGSVASGLVNNASNDVDAGALDTPGTNVMVIGGHSVSFTWDEELAVSTLAASDFTLTTAGGDVYPVSSVSLDSTKKIVTVNTSRAIAADEAGLLLKVATGGSFTDLAGNQITSIDADNSVAVQAFGDSAAYTLVGATQTAIAAPAIFVKDGTGKRISDLFKLTGGNTANNEGFLVDSLSLGITPATATLSEFTNVKLMWSTDTTVGGDVQVGSTVSTATSTVTFNGISKVIADSGLGYFYLTADVANTVSSSDTVTVNLPVGATAISETTGFAVVSTGVSAGTAVTVDMTAPSLNNAITQADHATTITVTITEANNLYVGATKVNTGADSLGSWTVTGANAADVSAIAVAADCSGGGLITITLDTAAAAACQDHVAKIDLAQLKDDAGNAIVNATTAANTVLTLTADADTWVATLGAS